MISSYSNKSAKSPVASSKCPQCDLHREAFEKADAQLSALLLGSKPTGQFDNSSPMHIDFQTDDSTCQNAVLRIGGVSIPAQSFSLIADAQKGTVVAHVVVEPRAVIAGTIDTVMKVVVGETTYDCVPEGTVPILRTTVEEKEDWNDMNNLPENNDVVLVRLGAEATHGRAYRLAYYHTPDPRSKEIGQQLSYWKWYENDIRFRDTSEMKWRKL